MGTNLVNVLLYFGVDILIKVYKTLP